MILTLIANDKKVLLNVNVQKKSYNCINDRAFV